jgi:MinD superfamily P-loop ATPase
MVIRIGSGKRGTGKTAVATNKEIWQKVEQILEE